MRHPSRLQITDLEHIESVVELELTVEESKKIVGGVSKSILSADVDAISDIEELNPSFDFVHIWRPCRTASSEPPGEQQD